MPWIKWCDRLWRVFSASLSECLQIIARCSLLPQTASFVLITWSRHCQLHRLRLTGESALQELVLLGLHRFQGGDSSQTRGYNRCCTLTTKLLALSQSIRCFRDDCRSFEPIHNRTLDILDIGIQVCINQNQIENTNYLYNYLQSSCFLCFSFISSILPFFLESL